MGSDCWMLSDCVFGHEQNHAGRADSEAERSCWVQGCFKPLPIVLLVDTERKSSHHTCQSPPGVHLSKNAFPSAAAMDGGIIKSAITFTTASRLISFVSNLLRRTNASHCDSLPASETNAIDKPIGSSFGNTARAPPEGSLDGSH